MALRLIFFTVFLLISTANAYCFSLNLRLHTHPRQITVNTSSILRYPKNASTLNIYMVKAVKPSRINIIAKDVVQLYNCSESTARRKILAVRDSLAKKEKQTITIKDFCNVYGLDYSETLQYLELI